MEMTKEPLYDKAVAAFDKAAGHRATEASILTTFNVGCELLRLRARIEELERERDDRERAFKDETLKERAEWEISVARERAAGSMWNEEAKLFRSQVAALTSQLAALEPLRIAAESFVQGTHKAWAPGTDGAALVAAVDALRAGEGT